MRQLILLLCLCVPGAAWATSAHAERTLHYRIYNGDDEAIGEYRIDIREQDAPARTVIRSRMQMSGKWMMIAYAMSTAEEVELDQEGIREFVIRDEFSSSLMSGQRRTHGLRKDGMLLLTIDEDDERETKRFPLDSFDTILRVGNKDQAAYAQMLRSAPVTLRGLNIMNGEIGQVEIRPTGQSRIQLGETELMAQRYEIEQDGADSEVWLLPDGRIYRSGSRFGHSVLYSDNQ